MAMINLIKGVVICVLSALLAQIKSAYLGIFVFGFNKSPISPIIIAILIGLIINNTTNNRILICNGDLLIKPETMSLITTQHSHILVEEHPSQGMEIGVTLNGKKEAGNFCFGSSNIWSEIAFLNNLDIIESFRKIVSSMDYKNKFIFEAFNDLIKTRHKLKVVFNETPVVKIDNIKTYHTVRKSL